MNKLSTYFAVFFAPILGVFGYVGIMALQNKHYEAIAGTWSQGPGGALSIIFLIVVAVLFLMYGWQHWGNGRSN